MTNRVATATDSAPLFSVGVFFESGGFYVVEPWRTLEDSRSAKRGCEKASPDGASFEIVDEEFRVIC